MTARLVEAQPVQDGTPPDAAAVFAEGEAAKGANASPTLDDDFTLDDRESGRGF